MKRREMLVLSGASALAAQSGEAPLRLGIAGLVHGHVSGFLRNSVKRSDVKIVGLSDPDPALRAKYAKQFGIPESALFAATSEMIDKAKPEAVASFGSTFDHADVVEACAAKRLPVMMEKPLAVSMDHARRIARAAASSGIPVMVNYETTWYPSHAAIMQVHRSGAGGKIRRMVAMDGHQGPKEINTPPEFFGWLSDPEKNGAGALFDFGCYGANLMTWMLGNQRPVAVTASTRTFKPHIYKRVDDDATILVEYPEAQGVIQASWNWPFSRKDFEVYSEQSYAVATGGNHLRVRLPGQQEQTRTPEPLPADEADSVSYLLSIARGRRRPEGLSSLENNMIVTEILTAARESARTGKRVVLPRS